MHSYLMMFSGTRIQIRSWIEVMMVQGPRGARIGGELVVAYFNLEFIGVFRRDMMVSFVLVFVFGLVVYARANTQSQSPLY
jgi:hypothetical protein